MIPSRVALRGMTRHARRLTPLSPTATTNETPVASTSSAAPPTPSSEPSSSRIGQYLVNRSINGELPVYSENTRGAVWKTIVRKIDGDVMSLRDDLATYMKEIHIDPLRPAPGVTIKPTNQHLVIKGRWVGEIKGFLEGRGF